MFIKLVNYKGRRVSFDIGENFTEININIQAGDEVAEVTYKNGTVLKFDSYYPEGKHRINQRIDASYKLFDEERNINLLHDEEWLARDNGEDFAMELFARDEIKRLEEEEEKTRMPHKRRNVFISLPMSGRADEAIIKDIQDAEDRYLRETGLKRHEVRFYNNLDGGKIALKFERDLADEHGANWIAPPDDKMGLWYLGIALNNLAYCDEAIFYGDWRNARGCQVEWEACQKYEIGVLDYSKTEKQKIYTVETYDCLEFSRVYGIYSSREKARRVCEKIENDASDDVWCQIGEYEVDAGCDDQEA